MVMLVTLWLGDKVYLDLFHCFYLIYLVIYVEQF